MREIFLIMGDDHIRVVLGREGQNVQIALIRQPIGSQIHGIGAHRSGKIIHELPDRIFSFQLLQRCVGRSAPLF